MLRLLNFLICALLAALVLAQSAAAARHELPRPASIEPAVKFWTRVYTEIDTRQGFLHDSRDLSIVYKAIKLPSLISHSSNDRFVSDQKKHIANILRTLAKGKRTGLSKDEKAVLELFPKNVSNSTLRTAASQIRFQLGQADRFRIGMIRSGSWRGYISRTLQHMDLPEELIALPHVESSFNPAARSHVGASGMWQFTQATGSRFMRIDHVIDERNDPYRATQAAAQLLKYNYSLTNNWALAITAYNHGVAGMRRAKQKLGTDDIGTIIEKYKSRTFGFASRNFYASFLAAADIDANAAKFFGPLKLEPEPQFEIVEVPDFVSAQSLSKVTGVGMQELMDFNPALQPLVWSGEKHVPRGYKLNVPFKGSTGYARQAIASLSPAERFVAQTPDTIHKVRRGETISTIAAHYKVSPNKLAQMNNLRNRHRIRIGQKLRLPPNQLASISIAAASKKQTPEAMPDSGIYRVRRGDTLSDIAERFGLRTTSLMAFNKIDNQHEIIPGQTLKLKPPRVKQIVSQTAAVQLAYFDSVDATSKPEPEQKAESDEEVEALPTGSVEITDDLIAQVESAEPTSADEVALLGLSLTPGASPAVSVDPSDYTVEDDDTIEVQAVETLGHYADWLGLPTNQLRQINNLRYGRALVIGKRLKLDFSSVSEKEFVERRTQFHRDMQQEFFARNRIEETHIYTVKGGDSVWLLAQNRYNVPVWLLRQYNPDIDLDSLQPGTKIIFPKIKFTDDSTDSEPSGDQPQLS